MRPLDNRASPPNIEGRHRIMMILWLAFLMSVGFFFLVAFLAAPARPVAAEDNPLGGGMMFWIFLALSLSMVGASFLLRGRLLAQSVAKQRIELVPISFIVAASLCEAAILFGLVYYFTSGEPRAFILMAVGALGIVAHMPRRAALLDASYKGQV